jgi:hypothetical protein
MFFHSPATSSILAASFIGRRNLVLLSPNLLHICSKREVDAVAAHELAHFRQRRRLIQYFFLLAMLGILLAGALVDQRFQFWLVLPAAVCVLLMSAGKRRLEFAADRFSFSITGDPQAMAAALAKISAANHTPPSGSRLRELFLSHPWPEKRIRRLGAGLDIGQTSPSLPAYSIDAPASAASGRPVALFAQTLVGFIRFLLSRTWLAAIVAGALAQFSESATFLALLFLAAVTAGYFAIAALWTRRLTRVQTKIHASLVKLHGAVWTPAPLCGMSPGIGRTIFDVGYDWDLGLLRTSGGSLCYAGDRASFAIPCASIDRIERLPGPAIRWKRKKVICIHFRSVGTPSIALNSKTDLFDWLRQWHAAGSVDTPVDCDFSPIGSVNWPQGQIVRRRVIRPVEFLRYLAAAVIPPGLAASFLFGWNLSPPSILPAAVAFALCCLFLGLGVVTREDVLVPAKQEKELASSSQSTR